MLAQYTLAVMAPVIMKIMVDSSYYEAYRVAPIIALAVSFYCMHNFFTIGAYIKKRTSLLPISFITATIVNVFLNWHYVPLYGYMAAAWISVGTYFIFSGVGFVVFRRIYYIPFEYGRLGFMFLSAICLGVLNNKIVFGNFGLEVAKEVAFVFALPLVLLFGPFLRNDERAIMLKMPEKALFWARGVFANK